jgi:dTDP-4-dehydrorhamnose reductase
MADNEKAAVIGTGLSGLIGTRFQQLFGDTFTFTNLDLSTGIDITDAAMVEQAVASNPAETLIHLAAFTNVSAAHEQTGDKSGLCYRINVEGTNTLAQAAAKYNKRFIHISTDFVFDGTKEDAYTEEDTPAPIEWYGRTKLWAEEVVQSVMPSGKWVILRLAYPYQAHPSRPDFLAGMIEKLTNDALPPAFTDHVITPTFADDLCRVFAHCISYRPSGIYHAVGSSSHSDFEIAQMVKETFNLPGEVKPGSLDEYLKNHPRPYQRTMRVSNEKIHNEFGIKMKSFREGLEEITFLRQMPIMSV